MQLERKLIESSLLKKGFVKVENKHSYFHHEYNGQRTGAFTYLSHGSGYKDYGIKLIKRMKPQLRLNSNKDVIELCSCPMSSEKYIETLKSNNVIT